MIYKPITDQKGVKDAFNRLRELFQQNAEGSKECSIHPKLKKLTGEFYLGNNNRYIIKFRHGSKGPRFLANVRPKSLDKPNSTGVSGLFVKDKRGRRFLTHNGNINSPRERKEKLLAFIGNGPQITVQGDNNSRFIVARIDDISASDFIGRISQVVQVVDSFKAKDGDPKPPCKLDRHSPLTESENPEMGDSAEEQLLEMARGGQGYGLSSEGRKVVENHAMKLAKKYYKNEGYQVEDTSRNNPYDLRCSTEEETIFIEVKGSTGSKDKILLTKNEVDCANKKDRKFELFVVSEIEIDKNANPPKARGGKDRIIKPWKPKRKCLTPVTYSYNLACHDDS